MYVRRGTGSLCRQRMQIKNLRTFDEMRRYDLFGFGQRKVIPDIGISAREEPRSNKLRRLRQILRMVVWPVECCVQRRRSVSPGDEP